MQLHKVQTILLVQKVWDSNPGSVKLNTVSPETYLREALCYAPPFDFEF